VDLLLRRGFDAAGDQQRWGFMHLAVHGAHGGNRVEAFTMGHPFWDWWPKSDSPTVANPAPVQCRFQCMGMRESKGVPNISRLGETLGDQ